MGVAVVLLANVFFWGGKCPNLGVVNVQILGVVNVRLANNLTPFCLTHMFFPGSGTKCPLGQNIAGKKCFLTIFVIVKKQFLDGTNLSGKTIEIPQKM